MAGLSLASSQTIAGMLTVARRPLHHNHDMTPIRVLIIAADPLARAGLSALMAGQPSVEVVGLAAPTDDLVQQTRSHRPDAVLWDLGWSPTEALESLADIAPRLPPILALAPVEETAWLWNSGVRGLLPRVGDATALPVALAAVAHGLLVLDPQVVEGLSRRAPPDAIEAPVEPLTARELEVLRGLGDGLANKEIARRLAISEHTVKFHVNAVLGKLGAQSRTEAVVRATRAGLIFL